MEKHPDDALPAPPGGLQTLASLYRNRGLLWQFVVRNVELRHKGSHLGLVWSILGPLVMMAVYTYVFGFIFGGSYGVLPDESRWDFGLGIFLSLAVFHLFTETLALAPTVISANANFVKKVVFPLEVLPVATAGASVVHFLITMCLVFVGVVTLGPGLAPEALFFPTVILPVILICVGLSLGMAALSVFWRDLAQLVPAASMILLFGSAVFYSPDKIARGGWQELLLLNPILLAIDQARNVVLWHQDPNWGVLGYLFIWGVLSTTIGAWLFARLRPGFADVL